MTEENDNLKKDPATRERGFDFDDNPISERDEDKFNIDPFAQSIANCIRALCGGTPWGSVIAIYGAWGSGKSSAINLVHHHLETSDIQIVNFPVWKYKDENAISKGFFEVLSSDIATAVSDDSRVVKRAKNMAKKLGKVVVGASGLAEVVMNQATQLKVGQWVKPATDIVDMLIENSNDPDRLQDKLSDILRDSGKHFLITIDDLDRLSPEESLIVFRLIKSIGRLPNVMYLLAYDRTPVEKAVRDKFKSEGPQYLEKIVQAGFDLPKASKTDLCSAIDKLHSELIEKLSLPKNASFSLGSTFMLFIGHLIRTPRDAIRLFNALSITARPIAKDVYFQDFVYLEAIRLFRPHLHRAILLHRFMILTAKKEEDIQKREDQSNQFDDLLLGTVPENDRENMKRVLLHLFPQLGPIWGPYGSDIRDCRRLRKVCAPEHFDTYFTYSISKRTVPREDIETFLDPSTSKEVMQQQLRNGLRDIQDQGRSKTSYLIEELGCHATDIDLESAERILSAIYPVADELLTDSDVFHETYCNNDVRIYILTSDFLLHKTKSDERSKILLRICENATLGLLTTIGIMTLHPYQSFRKRENKEIEEFLTDEPLATAKAAYAIRNQILHKLTSTSKELILNAWNPLYILVQWNTWQPPSSNQVQSFLESILKDDTSVAKLAEVCLRTIYGKTGSGPEGNTYRQVIADGINVLKPLLNLDKLRIRLHDVAATANLSGEQKEAVSDFLSLWEIETQKGANNKSS